VFSICPVIGADNRTFVGHPVFLTLCLAVDYTNKFDTCRSGGLTVALCLREEPAATM
jgi:hypothetical protein